MTATESLGLLASASGYTDLNSVGNGAVIVGSPAGSGNSSLGDGGYGGYGGTQGWAHWLAVDIHENVTGVSLITLYRNKTGDIVFGPAVHILRLMPSCGDIYVAIVALVTWAGMHGKSSINLDSDTDIELH